MIASPAPLQQGAHGGFVVAFDMADGVVDQGVADIRVLLRQLRQFGFDHAGDIDVAGALGAEDAGYHLLVAVQLGEGARLLEGVHHLAQVAQPDFAAAGRTMRVSRRLSTVRAPPASGSPVRARRTRSGRRPGRYWWREAC